MEIFVMYDTTNKTWNIMKKTGEHNIQSECIFYGSIYEISKWLEDNKESYVEVKN